MIVMRLSVLWSLKNQWNMLAVGECELNGFAKFQGVFPKKTP